MQTRALSCNKHSAHGWSRASLSRAKRTLKQLSFVGLVELYSVSLCLLRYKVHGVVDKTCECGHASAEQTHILHNVPAHDISDVDAETVRAVDEITALDDALYREAMGTFLSEVRAMEEQTKTTVLCKSDLAKFQRKVGYLSEAAPEPASLAEGKGAFPVKDRGWRKNGVPLFAGTLVQKKDKAAAAQKRKQEQRKQSLAEGKDTAWVAAAQQAREQREGAHELQAQEQRDATRDAVDAAREAALFAPLEVRIPGKGALSVVAGGRGAVHEGLLTDAWAQSLREKHDCGPCMDCDGAVAEYMAMGHPVRQDVTSCGSSYVQGLCAEPRSLAARRPLDLALLCPCTCCSDTCGPAANMHSCWNERCIANEH